MSKHAYTSALEKLRPLEAPGIWILQMVKQTLKAESFSVSEETFGLFYVRTYLIIVENKFLSKTLVDLDSSKWLHR
uniref:Putative ovule protein n=1 Tax=Solanum chacoense TaxID=4108 RepID=A0A0V0GZF0_SOLCH